MAEPTLVGGVPDHTTTGPSPEASAAPKSPSGTLAAQRAGTKKTTSKKLPAKKATAKTAPAKKPVSKKAS